MPGKDPNCYKRARQQAGLTQEAAAEVLATSVESLKAYETGHRLPPNWMAASMADVYGAPWLAVEHLQATSGDLGVMPEIHVQGLPTAVLTLVNRCAGLDGQLRQLMRIAEDGVIDEGERDSFDDIAAELAGLIGAAYQVLYPANCIKKDRLEVGASKRSGFKGQSNHSNDHKTIISHRAEKTSPNFGREGGAFL